MASTKFNMPTDNSGKFTAAVTAFRDKIEKRGRFEAEAGRYHLYVAYACPFASRCLAVYYLKGLEDVIGLSVTHGTFQRTRPDDPSDTHAGWIFRSPSDPPLANPAGYGSFDCEGCIPDTVNNTTYVRDLYDLAKGSTGRYSVPVLWDKKEGTIVNNESAEILIMLNNEFNHLAKYPEIDLCPANLQKEITEANEWIYKSVNMGVYACGFATTQAAYDAAFQELFAGLDRCEEILSRQRYIAGDVLTEADIKLFVTLIRFDEVYVVYFKTNKRCVREYPNLRNYVTDIYNTPRIAKSVNMKHIKDSYFSSHPQLNAYAIVPGGSEYWWEGSHDRDAKFPSPK